MVVELLDKGQQEAQQLSGTLKDLDRLLEKVSASYPDDISNLRRTVKKMLVGVNTDVELLANLEKEDIFKTNPVFATQRYQVIKNMEEIQIDFEFEILPALEKITRRTVEQTKQNPPAALDESTLPAPPKGETWTVKKVIETAEGFLDQANKSVGVLTKAYGLVKALGLVVGIPIP